MLLSGAGEPSGSVGAGRSLVSGTLDLPDALAEGLADAEVLIVPDASVSSSTYSAHPAVASRQATIVKLVIVRVIWGRLPVGMRGLIGGFRGWFAVSWVGRSGRNLGGGGTGGFAVIYHAILYGSKNNLTPWF